MSDQHQPRPRVKIVAEIGINHNGDLPTALALIDTAKRCGCDYVKFQKRTVEAVYSAEELARPRESVFGKTNGDLKRGLEFGQREYEEIDRYCKGLGIPWFASCWDGEAVDFIARFNPPYLKIASASLTDDLLIARMGDTGIPLILSTGMSNQIEVDRAVWILRQEGRTDSPILLHCCSAYPADYADLHLNMIPALRARYRLPVGYSGHETGIPASVAAAALGAVMIERHITLDRSMWGTDQAASLGPSGLEKLVQYIRIVEMAMGGEGDSNKRLLPCEVEVRRKLRKGV